MESCHSYTHAVLLGLVTRYTPQLFHKCRPVLNVYVEAYTAKNMMVILTQSVLTQLHAICSHSFM